LPSTSVQTLGSLPTPSPIDSGIPPIGRYFHLSKPSGYHFN
jgi:hypothetical protein